jgi:hypothetical protein
MFLYDQSDGDYKRVGKRQEEDEEIEDDVRRIERSRARAAQQE